MKIPLTKYGWPQVAVLPGIIITTMVLCPLAADGSALHSAVILIEAILAIVLVWVLAFFRDPRRISPDGDKNLLAPADGTIADIEVVEENNFIGGSALKIGIFMSIFNTHINRSPCNVKIEQINYKKGKYKDARNPLAGKVNESKDLKLIRTDEPTDRLIVRQISGAIARRIVCRAVQGQLLAIGEKFGMIKFGSRTELYVPARNELKCLVKTGQKVKAGITVLARYEKCPD